MNPAHASVLILENLALKPHAFSITADIDETQTVCEIKLENVHYTSRRLENAALPDDIALLMIERSGDILIPDREAEMRANDTIALVGSEEAVDQAARQLAWRA
jgi:Trk K+ transport system NAD-binding subunit